MALDFLWEGGNCPRRGQGHGFLLIGRWGWFTWSSVTSAEEVEWGEKKVVCEFQYVSRLRDVSVACVCVFPWVQLEFNLNSDAIFSRVWQPQTHIHTPFPSRFPFGIRFFFYTRRTPVVVVFRTLCSRCLLWWHLKLESNSCGRKYLFTFFRRFLSLCVCKYRSWGEMRGLRVQNLTAHGRHAGWLGWMFLRWPWLIFFCQTRTCVFRI